MSCLITLSVIFDLQHRLIVHKIMMIIMMMITMMMMMMYFRCFNDVKMAVWISIATGQTIGLDLEVLRKNSGLVRPKI